MRVTIVTTGGTIASRTDPDTGASVAAVTAEDLLAGVPQLRDVATVEAMTFALVNSWDMTPAAMADLTRLVRRRAGEQPATDGFVVTHGTDTMEETAFALDLLLDLDQPVVVTGAMRPADAPGADGPANLLAAVHAAAAPVLRRAGTVVVMNDELHAARYVTKTHTTAVDTFASPDTGPLGRVGADVTLRWRPEPLPRLEVVDPEPAVELITMVAGLGGAPLRRLLDAGVRGVVVAGSGSGNLDADAVPALRELLAAGVPVVLASRCVAGRVTPSYGGPGGGATLVELGAIPAGDLSGPKARLALMFLLGAGSSTADVRAWFAAAA